MTVLTGSTAKEHQRRERLRAYEAVLEAARERIAVMVLFVEGREARLGGGSLEEAFATADTGREDGRRLPAAVWVALRQGDVDTVLDALVAAADEQFLIGAHEQLDDGYRLTTVEELRGVPDLNLLQAQLAAVLNLPVDVIEVTAAWGPDDPRTTTEIETLLDRRFGPVGRVGTVPGLAPAGAAVPVTARPALRLSGSEFAALLALTGTQRGVLATLIRQADLVVTADGTAGGADEAAGPDAPPGPDPGGE